MKENRVVLNSIWVKKYGEDEVEIEVIIGYKNLTQTSKVISSSEQHHLLRSVAHVTIQALNGLLHSLGQSQSILIKLVDFKTLVLANINQVVFLVVIETIEKEEENFVSGSSMAQIEALHIEEEAKFNVARATLNATNRKLSKYI